MRRLLAIAVALCALVAVPLIAFAQTANPEEQKSLFLRWVQDRLSTPDRQISISNINGVLSSDASIDEITVADQKGVYLRIEHAAINWNQAALFGGRLEINSLTAQSIEYLRNPVPAEGGPPELPSPEAKGLAIPQLPVAVIVKKLSVPRISFGEQVFGLGSAISLDGSITLDGGSLQSALDIQRLDGPGGTLAIKADYDKASTELDLDAMLSEPEDGIIANLLNIEGRPAVRLNIAGSGPVADLTANLTFDAGGTRALSGTARIDQQPEGFAFDATLGGPVASLVAPAYREFFGTESSLEARGLLRSAGGVRIDEVKLSGGELSLTGSAATSADGFLDELHLKGVMADAAGGDVVLPVKGAATTLERADLTVDYGGGTGTWNANLGITKFANGTLAADKVEVAASGIAANLDQPDQRRLTFNADGTVSGVSSINPDIAAALGESIGLGAAGRWNAGNPVDLAQFRLVGKALSLEAAGQFDGARFDGTIGVKTASLSPFSGVAGRDLAGSLDLSAKGSIEPLSGGFDLDFDGTGTNLRIDQPALDNILAGTVRLSGGLARTAQGVTARAFRIANRQVRIGADGNFASDAADFRFDLALADLGLVSDRASGALTVTGTAKGEKNRIALALDASVPDGQLLGRPLAGATVRFGGTLDAGALDGTLDGSATLGGQPINLASTLSSRDGVNKLAGLDFRAGETRLTGDLTQTAEGLYEGRLRLASTDLATAGALMLVKATGAADATISLSASGGRQGADIVATIRDVVTDAATVGHADIKASIADLFGVPRIDGTMNGSTISAAGLDVRTLKATASRTGSITRFDATAALATGTDFAAAGALTPLGDGYELALDQLSLRQGDLTARLDNPVKLAVTGDSVSMNDVRFAIGGGTLTASGTAGKSIDVRLDVRALPLSVANAVMPSLGLGGTVQGTARITGAADAPRAEFDLRGTGLTAAAVEGFGITPLGVTARGSYAGGAVTLANLEANSPGGLSISASGRVPLEGTGLDLRVEGTAPMALANRFLASRGAQASGTIRLSARVSGSARAPQFSGRASVSGGTYVDPGVNIRLVDITGNATLSGNAVNIERVTASVTTGGTIAASGSISLRPPAYTADLRVALNHTRYVDRTLFVATVSGDLTLKGPLTQGPVLGGAIRVEKADITVPERIGGGAADIRVRHVALPAPVAATLARAEVDVSGRPVPAARPSAMRLDLTVTAPNQVFIRGRGLDAEAGGSLRLTGSVDQVIPVGAFRLIRGRLSILGQRIVFDSGTVTLTGSLDPEIDLSASIAGDDITVLVRVSGRASDLAIDFTSTPPLPQDEVLSRLLFRQGIDQLSPLQLAKLAAAAGELAGGGGSGLLDSLRQSTGLDDLDIITDAQGNAALKAGRYIEDNVYVGVEAGAEGRSKITLNLDLTPSLKATASTGTDGGSSVGIFYEQDY